MQDQAYRPVGRRAFLAMVGLGAAGVVAGAPVQRGLERLFAPLADRDATGLTSLLPGTSKFRFYSVVGYDPHISRDAYRLRVAGMVERPLDLGFADLLDRPVVGMTKDFQCVTGWRVADVEWEGVRVAELLDEAGVDSSATHVRFTSHDGVYTTTLTLDQARRDDVIVATAMLGGDISADHGGPVRLYVAPMYGYKSLKWLAGIEATDQPDPEGFWEVRGYDADAWIGGSNGRTDEPV